MNFSLLLILWCSQRVKAFDASSKEKTGFMIFSKHVMFHYQIAIELHLPNEVKSFVDDTVLN